MWAGAGCFCGPSNAYKSQCLSVEETVHHDQYDTCCGWYGSTCRLPATIPSLSRLALARVGCTSYEKFLLSWFELRRVHSTFHCEWYSCVTKMYDEEVLSFFSFQRKLFNRFALSQALASKIFTCCSESWSPGSESWSVIYFSRFTTGRLARDLWFAYITSLSQSSWSMDASVVVMQSWSLSFRAKLDGDWCGRGRVTISYSSHIRS